MHSKTKTQLWQVVLAAVAALCLVGAVTAPAYAQSSDDDVSVADVVAGDASAFDALAGLSERAGDYWEGIFAEAPAQTGAEDFRTEVNDNSAIYQSYLNDRVNATSEFDVLAVTFADAGETATVYVTADVNGSDYEHAAVVTSTDRTVDESCELSDNAARNAADELGTLREEYVSDDEAIPASEVARLGGRYKGNIDCTFLGGDS